MEPKNEIRIVELGLIEEILDNYPKFKKLNSRHKKKIAEIIEKSILKATIDKSIERSIPVYWDSDNFVEQYSNIGYHVKINLDINSEINLNKPEKIRNYLAEQVYLSYLCLYLETLFEKYTNIPFLKISLPIRLKILGFISNFNLKRIGYMNSLELNPNINQVYIDELKLRSQQTIKIKYSQLYKCSKCSNSKTQMREIQTRCLDEGATLFIYCLVCGHNWRQY